MFLAVVIGAAGIQLFLAGAAVGQTWNGAPGGNWGTASNWTPATIPNSSSATATFDAVNNVASAVFLTGGPFTVGTLNLNNDVSGGFFIEDGTLQLAGQATINVQSHNPLVDLLGTINIQSNATLNTVFADSTLTIAGTINNIGFSFTKIGPGTLILTGASTSAGDTIVNGGTLVIQNGSKVASNGFLEIGLGNGSIGAATLTGAGSSFTTDLTVFVGDAGNGTLTIQNGAAVSDGVGDIAVSPGTSGTATVTGPGSTWTNSGDLEVGLGGTGTLTIQNGGSVSGVGGDIGGENGSSGTVTATGVGSTWTNSGVFEVGYGGTGKLTIQNGAAALTSTLEIGALTGSSGTVTVSGAGSTWTNSAAAFVGGGPDGPGGAGLLQITNGGTVNAAATTIWNTGTLAIGGTFTLNSPLTIDGGTVRTLSSTNFTNNATLGVGGATFDSNGFDSTFSGAFTGSGGIDKINAGTLTLTGSNTYTGGTIISLGVLQIGNGGTTGSIVGDVTDNGALVFSRADTVTFAGTISGTGSLEQSGTGKTVLTANNTYTGGTTINAGTLQLGNGGTAGSVVGNVTNDGSLVFNRSDSITFNGAISGTGGVTETGGGTLALNANNTYSGGTAINGGTLVAAANNSLGSGLVSVNDASLLGVNPGVTIANFVRVNDTGSLDNAGVIQVTAVGEGPSGAVTTSGGATISNAAGATVAGVGLIGIQSLNGPAIVYNSGLVSGVQGIRFSDGGTITNNAGGVITGSSGLAITSSGGSTNFSNSGTVNGNVALGNSANTVQLFSGSRINGSLSLGTSAASNLILDGSAEQPFSQAVTGTTTNAGSLTKQGSGNWILDIAMNAPVSTKILAGVLTVNGSLNSPAVTVETGGMLKGIGVVNGNLLNGGSVSPGNSPGTLTVNGNFTQGSSGIYNVEIVSPQSYSRLLVTGRANLGGTLQLTLASRFRPSPGQQFVVLSAGQGISGTFRSVIDPGGPPVQAAYQNGAVEVSAGSTAKAAPVFLPSDGTPAGTTALVSDYVFFNSLGSLAGRTAATSDRSIGITFDGGEFDFEGQHGQTYGFPIAGHLKLTDRVALDYEIPLQYVDLPESSFFEAGAILNFPIKMLIASETQPWSWNATPTAAIASTGSKEIIGAGALSNVVSCRWHNITMTYGNYISFFEGETLVSNDPAFPKGTSQQIMKNGLKVDFPFGKGWILEPYGIYTQFFRSAAVSSYYTIGAEVGRHIIWKLEDQPIDLGYYSVGLYIEQGNHYNSGHLQFGSGWKF